MGLDTILQTLQKIRNALRTQSISAQDRLEDFDMSAFVRDLYDEGSVPLFHGHEISELKSMHDNAVYRVTKACNELREKAIQSLLRDYLDVLYKVERRHRTSIGGPMTLPPPVPTSPYGSVPYPYGHPSSSPHALPSSYVPPPAPSVRAEFAPAPPSESTFDPRMTQSTTYPSFDPSSSRTDVVPSYDAPSSSFDPSSYDALPPSGQRMVDPPRPGSRAPRPDPTASANTDRMPVPSSNVKGSSYVPPSPPSLPMVQWSSQYTNLEPYVSNLPYTVTEPQANALSQVVQDSESRGRTPDQTLAVLDHTARNMNLTPIESATPPVPVNAPSTMNLAPPSTGTRMVDPPTITSAPPVEPSLPVVQWSSQYTNLEPYVSKLPYTVTEPQANALSQVVQDSESRGRTPDQTLAVLDHTAQTMNLTPIESDTVNNNGYETALNDYESNTNGGYETAPNDYESNAAPTVSNGPNGSSKDQRNAAKREPTYAVKDVVDEYDELQPYVGVLPETLTETNAIELARAVQDANARGLSPEKTQALVETEIEALGLNRPTNNASDLEPVVDPVLPGLPTSDGNGSNDNGPFENAPPSPNGDDSFFDSNDPYVVLGVSKDATASELRRAYRSAQLRAHPNKGGSNPAFRKVQNAYKRLEPLHRRKDPVRSRNANVATDSSSNESSKDQRNAAEREPTYAVEDVVDEYDELQPYVGVLPETLTETNAIELASAVQDANARGLSPEKTQALVETEIEALGLNRPTNNASDLEPVVDPVLPGLPTSDGNGSNDNGPFENAPPSPNGDDSFFDSNDPYVVLGVSKDATASELRRAYRSAQLRAHPNKGGSNPAFRKVQNAYKRLEPLHRRKDPVRSRNANVATDPSSNGSTNAMSVSTFVRRYPETRPYANELPPTISDPMGVSIRREIQQGNQRGSSVPQIRNRVRNVVLYNARRNIVPVPEHDDREDRIEENDANLNDLGFRTPDGNVESLNDSSNVAYNNTNDETYETASEDEYLDATNQGNNNVRNVIPFQNRGVGRVSNGGNRAPNEEYAMEPNEVEFRTPDGNVESLNVLENEPNADGSNLGELENERFDENEVAGQGFTETDLNAWQSNETDATNGSMQSNQTRLNLENPFTGEMNPPLEGEVPEETRESTPNEREFVLRSHPLHGLPEYEDDEENENEFRLRSHPLPDLSSEEENDPEPTLQSHPLEGLSEEGENEDPFERDGADMDGVGDNNEGLFRPTNAANFDLTGGDDGFGSNGQNEVAENAFDTWNEQDEPDDEEENNRAAENGGNGGWVDDGTQSRPTPLPPPMKNAGVQTKRVPNVPMKTSGMQTNNSRNRNGKKRPTNRPASDNASKENAPNKPATTNPAQETNLSLPPPPNTGNLISGSNTNRTNASNGSLARFNTLARASNSNDGSDTTNVSFFNPLAYNRWKKNNNGTYTVPNAGGKNNETDPYAVLETTADATDDAIRSAYKVMALKKHPNKGGSAEAFRAVKNAYNRIRLARGMS